MTVPRSDTHRRADLRGRESVARWRLQTGAWTGRVLAVVFAASGIGPLLRRGGPAWPDVVLGLVLAAAALVLAQRILRGSRGAAVALLVGYLVAKALMVLAGEPWYQGLLVTTVVVFGLSQGIWGATSLAAVRREAPLVPPAPPRTGSTTAATRPPAIGEFSLEDS